MRSRVALLLACSAAAAQAQYYYTDNFASYNSGAWGYPTGSGLQFGGSGLSGTGSDFTTALTALNNGGDPYRHEIKATFSSLPTSFYATVDLWLV